MNDRSAPSAPAVRDLEASVRWCKLLAKRTAGNFYFSFLTLPADQLRDMCVLYAFMRVTDDIGDDAKTSIADRRAALEEWRRNLQVALSGGEIDHPALPALADLVIRQQIPHEYLFAVIDGVERDLDHQGFETFRELEEYCYLVAGAVGLCCIHVWGFEGEDAIPLAIDCGVAFQLTNILRDLSEDARLGRIYLPKEDLERFGYSPEDLFANKRNSDFQNLMAFEVSRAREFYHRAERLFPCLQPAGRSIYAAMLGIYGGLLDEIERRDFDVYTKRVRLPRWRKLWIALGAWIRHRWLRR